MPSLANAIVVFKKRNTTKLKIAMPPILEKKLRYHKQRKYRSDITSYT